MNFGDPWCSSLPLGAMITKDLHQLGVEAVRGADSKSSIFCGQDDVRQRYIDLVLKQKERQTRHELAITKVPRLACDSRSERPPDLCTCTGGWEPNGLRVEVLWPRFRMIPADLYVVPSEENFPLAKPLDIQPRPLRV